MFSLAADGSLSEMSKVASGGVKPVSITVYGSTVYVVNAGDGTATNPAGISGFTVSGSSLAAIAGSTHALSTNDAAPGQISFTPDGKFLIVTEKNNSKLDTFTVTNGVAGTVRAQNSAGLTPFAFVFSPEGYLVVAEVGSSGAGPNSSVSSYSIAADGTLTAITSALATNQAAACWVAIAGGTAYVANATSATITGINVSTTGQLSLHDATGITATTGQGAIDLALSPDNGFLYSLSGNPRGISIFQVAADGSLTSMPALANVPVRASGLVAR
jgi:6-phosphogluconolactonase (cycloisomerase 2 family)